MSVGALMVACSVYDAPPMVDDAPMSPSSAAGTGDIVTGSGATGSDGNSIAGTASSGIAGGSASAGNGGGAGTQSPNTLGPGGVPGDVIEPVAGAPEGGAPSVPDA